MSPYKTYDVAAAKIFGGNTPEELENNLNQWLDHNPCNVLHMSYQRSPSSHGEDYSCLIIYSLLEYEVEM